MATYIFETILLGHIILVVSDDTLYLHEGTFDLSDAEVVRYREYLPGDDTIRSDRLVFAQETERPWERDDRKAKERDRWHQQLHMTSQYQRSMHQRFVPMRRRPIRG